ncbi:hypothetical protein AB833_17115 [Chromatiales bacterium (ex Bugula neritina AB1)]|nr:hypothetical protein AB833_17115 [Chromatiales bacterium (ex Bugula neritina AB1)]
MLIKQAQNINLRHDLQAQLFNAKRYCGEIENVAKELKSLKDNDFVSNNELFECLDDLVK